MDGKLLVGIDGSDAATHALGWAAGLVTVLSAGLVIATVYVADPTDVRSWDEAHQRAAERLEQWSEPARVAGLPYEPVLLDGEPGPALLQAADDRDVGLIVVSRRGRTGVDALVTGSTADYVSHHASRPLAIVPPEGPGSSPTHVLVALNGTPDSGAAASWAARLAAGLAARTTAVYMPPVPEIFGSLTPAQRAVADEALTERWAAPLRAAGLAPECRVLEGRHVADALLECAREVGADLIVAGTRRIAGLRPIRLGGVTMELLHRSPVPVIVVPPAP